MPAYWWLLIPLAGLVMTGSGFLVEQNHDEPEQLLGRLRWVGFAVGVVLVVIAALLTSTGQHTLVSMLWITGLLVAVGSLLSRVQRLPWVEMALLAGLIVAAFAVRLPLLAILPPEVHGDEAAIGNEARRLLAQPQFLLAGVGWYDVPNLSFVMAIPTMLFSDSLTGLRLASVIQGVSSVVVTFLLGRRLFGPRAGFVAAALVAASAWHLHFSRTGFHYMQSVLVTVTGLWLLVRGMDRRSSFDLLAAGIVFGAGWMVYYASRLAIVIGGVYLVMRFLRDPAARFRGLPLVGAGFVLVLLPMLPVILASPQALMSRTSGVSIFSPENRNHVFGSLQATSITDVVLLQAAHTAEAFTTRGETSVQFGWKWPLFDPITTILLFAGLFALPFWRPGGVLLISWIGLTLVVGSITTIDALFGPRAVIVIPAIALAAAYTLERGLVWLPRWMGHAVAAGSVVAVAFIALPPYFQQYPFTRPASFRTTLGRWLAETGPSADYVVWVHNDPVLTYESTRFLAHGIPATEVRGPALPDIQRTPGKPLKIVLEYAQPDQGARVQQIVLAYPTVRLEQIADGTGPPLFVVATVDP